MPGKSDCTFIAGSLPPCKHVQRPGLRQHLARHVDRECCGTCSCSLVSTVLPCQPTKARPIRLGVRSLGFLRMARPLARARQFTRRSRRRLSAGWSPRWMLGWRCRQFHNERLQCLSTRGVQASPCGINRRRTCRPNTRAYECRAQWLQHTSSTLCTGCCRS